MLKKRPDFRTGDIVAWSNVVHGTRQVRVVQAWTDGEPYSLLVAPLEKGDYICYVAMCYDCVLVERGPDEALVFKPAPLGGSYARGFGEVREPCKHPVPVENHC
jgi:hypothetical protein